MKQFVLLATFPFHPHHSAYRRNWELWIGAAFINGVVVDNNQVSFKFNPLRIAVIVAERRRVVLIKRYRPMNFS